VPPPARHCRTYAVPQQRPVGLAFADRACLLLAERLLGPALTSAKPGGDDIRLYPLADGFGVAVNGSPVAGPVDIDEALGHLIDGIADLANPGARWTAVIHAAAVARNGRAIVLPGINGSGKSTLTAALVHAGFGYLSDDTVRIDGRRREVVGIPLALCVKEPSWHLLRRHYPILDDLPVHRGPAGPQRYLNLSRHVLTATRLPLAAVVFPRFEENRPVRLAILPVTTALQYLLDARCWLSLEQQEFRQTLELLSECGRFELSYGDYNKAVDILTDLTNK
jgi:hypothetical protein